jgi:hypothetical protein
MKNFGNSKSHWNRHNSRKNSCTIIKKLSSNNLVVTPPNPQEEHQHLLIKSEINTKTNNIDTNDFDKKKDFICEFCTGSFCKKYNLDRHLQICKEKEKIEKNKIIDENTKNTIKNNENNDNICKINEKLNGINKLKLEINKLNKNLKKLEESIPDKSSQLVNNHLINKIIEKEKKIDEFDLITKQFVNENFPYDIVNKNIRPNNIVLIDDINDTNINNDDNINNDIIDNNKPINLILNNQIIQFRETDNYINATQLCKAGGKKLSHWICLDNTKELISVLASDIGIPASQLIDSKKGNSNNFEQGTWIHPDLAIQLAQWISARFALQVSSWIRQLFTEGKVEINLKILKEKENTIKDYEKRIKILENMTLKRQKRTIYPDKNVVYIITNKLIKKERKYVIGQTVDLTDRLSTYNKSEEHEVIYYKSFGNEEQMDLAEKMVLKKLDEYRDQGNRDRFVLPPGENIKLFTDPIDKAFFYFN